MLIKSGGIKMSEEENQENQVSVLKADIGYFDGELKTIPFNQGDNIQTLLTKANLSFGDGQSINDEDGNNVEVTAQAEEGKTYYITGNFKQGQ